MEYCKNYKYLRIEILAEFSIRCFRMILKSRLHLILGLAWLLWRRELIELRFRWRMDGGMSGKCGREICGDCLERTGYLKMERISCKFKWDSGVGGFCWVVRILNARSVYNYAVVRYIYTLICTWQDEQ